MSLNGDLENFPIIDIIQLLHGTKKTGVLRLSSKKGESQLVFHEGDLVSANHLNNRVRIGQVLVSAGAITEGQLTQVLEIQKNAGGDRKPLVITLLEHGMVDETVAYNGLEALIEMTIVEVLTWKSGNFSLDLGKGDNPDGYHFSRTKFPQRILLNSQGILMESLRIFDEKTRDGTMDEILSIAGITNQDLDAEQPENCAPPMSSTGHDQDKTPSKLHQLLTEQRNMTRRSRDHSYRELDALKKLIIAEFPTATKDLKRQLLKLLANPGPEENIDIPAPDMAVIVLTRSPLISTVIRSICYQENIYALSADNIDALAINIRLLLCQSMQLVIFLDVPHDNSMQDALRICDDIQHYPQTTLVLVACASFWSTWGLPALSTGIRSIIPKPCQECTQGSSAQQALFFCSNLGAFLRSLSSKYAGSDEQRFFTCLSRLCNCKTRMEIDDTILEYLIVVFERAIVFVVKEFELVAESSFGIKRDKSEGLSSLSDLRIPFDDQQIFEDVVKTGQMYYGFHSDSTWPHQLYQQIGRPDSPEVLLFPLIRANTVVAFICADFGPKPASSPSLCYLDALLQYTTAQISVSAYRQKLKSMLEQMKMPASLPIN